MQCTVTINREHIVVSPLQQWSRERATIIRYTYTFHHIITHLQWTGLTCT